MFKDRPWIWIIIAHVVVIAVLTSVVIIAKKHGPQEIPLVHSNGH